MERLLAMINGNALSPPLSFRNAIPVGADRAATPPSLGRGDGPDLGLVAGYDAEQLEALHGERAGRVCGGACGPLTPHRPAVSVYSSLSNSGLERTPTGASRATRHRPYQGAGRRTAARCRAKNRSELSVSNDGRSPCLPGLACSVFSAEAMASNSARLCSRGTRSCQGFDHCRSAARTRGSAATNGTPSPQPIDIPQ